MDAKYCIVVLLCLAVSPLGDCFVIPNVVISANTDAEEPTHEVIEDAYAPTASEEEDLMMHVSNDAVQSGVHDDIDNPTKTTEGNNDIRGDWFEVPNIAPFANTDAKEVSHEVTGDKFTPTVYEVNDLLKPTWNDAVPSGVDGDIDNPIKTIEGNNEMGVFLLGDWFVLSNIGSFTNTNAEEVTHDVNEGAFTKTASEVDDLMKPILDDAVPSGVDGDVDNPKTIEGKPEIGAILVGDCFMVPNVATSTNTDMEELTHEVTEDTFPPTASELEDLLKPIWINAFPSGVDGDTDNPATTTEGKNLIGVIPLGKCIAVPKDPTFTNIDAENITPEVTEVTVEPTASEVDDLLKPIWNNSEPSGVDDDIDNPTTTIEGKNEIGGNRPSIVAYNYTIIIRLIPLSPSSCIVILCIVLLIRMLSKLIRYTNMEMTPPLIAVRVAHEV